MGEWGARYFINNENLANKAIELNSQQLMDVQMDICIYGSLDEHTDIRTNPNCIVIKVFAIPCFALGAQITPPLYFLNKGMVLLFFSNSSPCEELLLCRALTLWGFLYRALNLQGSVLTPFPNPAEQIQLYQHNQ